jgi:hypothetical protein
MKLNSPSDSKSDNYSEKDNNIDVESQRKNDNIIGDIDH